MKTIPAGSKIKELHVFSHSIGGGLYVGYGDAVAQADRNAAIASMAGTTRKISYARVLAAETGGILTDHLVEEPLKSERTLYKNKFAGGAITKLWGCNSGVSGWTYTDRSATGVGYVYEEAAAGKEYYWCALNTKNTPKPSVAQALSDYFGVSVLGAGSGSHIEVLHKGAWITSTQYKAKTGKFAGEPQTLRLNPDHGVYNDFAPAVKP